MVEIVLQSKLESFTVRIDICGSVKPSENVGVSRAIEAFYLSMALRICLGSVDEMGAGELGKNGDRIIRDEARTVVEKGDDHQTKFADEFVETSEKQLG
jgi:hypothetical protein